MNLQAAYLEKLLHTVDTVDARGLVQLLTVKAPLDIDDIYVPLSLRLEDEAPHQPETEPPQPVPEADEDAEFAQDRLWQNLSCSGLSLENLWENHPYWMILGQPGAGKSTFLKFQVLHHARSLQQSNSGALPLWLEWQSFAQTWQTQTAWTESNALLNYWQDNLAKMLELTTSEDRALLASEIKIALTSHNALLLCDSLDSIYDVNIQQHCMQALESLLDQYPGNRCLVTARHTAYQQPVPSRYFHHAFVEPFNPTQIEEFFRRWLYAIEKSKDLVENSATRERAEQQLQQMLAHLQNKPELRARLGTPFLCALVGVAQRQADKLPEQAVNLYKLCIDTLILHGETTLRDLPAHESPLNHDEVLAILEYIALSAQENHSHIFSRADIFAWAVEVLQQRGLQADDAHAKAESLQAWLNQDSALLSRIGHDIYAFTHVLFQEYLAACALLRQPAQVLDACLAQHLFDPYWRGVIRLAAAHQGAVDEAAGTAFIKLLLAHPHPREETLFYTFRLAFQCMLDSHVSFQLADQMFQHWVQLYQDKPALQPALTRLLRNAQQLRYKPAAITPLLDILKVADTSMRSNVAEALGHLQDPNSLPLLQDVLKQDILPSLRAKAAEALGKTESAIPALLASLQNDNTFIVRRQCAITLGRLHHPSVLPVLQQAVQDSDPTIRWRAAEALGYLKEQAAVPALLKLLRQDEIPGVRWRAAEALGLLRDIHAVENLRFALNHDKDTTVRSRAAEALGVFPSSLVLETLQNALTQDKFPAVRWRAAEALGKLQDPQVLQVLLDTLARDVDNAVRWSAAEALGYLRDKRALATLLKTVREDLSPSVRWSAAEALGHLRCQEAVPVLLLSIRHDKFASVRSKACQALGLLQDSSATADLIKILESDPEPMVRRRAAESLGQLRDPTAVPVLLNCVKQDQSPSVRWLVLHALGQFKAPDITPTLLDVLEHDEDLTVRWQAAHVLERLDFGSLIG